MGKINELGAEIAMEDGDKVIEAIRSSRHFYEADAFMLIASAAGGTGSGSMPIMTKIIKERFQDKRVYSLVALPFEHEEKTDARTFYNAATCLKAVYQVADAVFLVDNQRYVEKDSSLINNMSAINRLIAAPFYDLLCAGEEKKAKHIGARLLDAGDIMQTIAGWTVLGYGTSTLPSIKNPFEFSGHFRKKSTETHRGIQAMDEAVSNLSLNCNPADSGSALYLLSAPQKDMNMDLVKELGDYLSGIAPEAIIRYGDYPRGGGKLKITVILSQLSSVAKVKSYYDRMPDMMAEQQKKDEENEAKLKELVHAAAGVPSLCGGNGS